MIRVVGPGGAGKTTVGRPLAKRLGTAFVDLDQEFSVRAGNISGYLSACGYKGYAARNIEVYLATLGSLREKAVIALSSGFMTYDSDAHPRYCELRRQIVSSPSTIV